MTDYHIGLKYLEDNIARLDELLDDKTIDTAQYLQIALLLKILEEISKK